MPIALIVQRRALAGRCRAASSTFEGPPPFLRNRSPVWSLCSLMNMVPPPPPSPANLSIHKRPPLASVTTSQTIYDAATIETRAPCLPGPASLPITNQESPGDSLPSPSSA